MRRALFTAFLVAAAFVTGGWVALQTAPPPVVSIHYMKAAPGDAAAYERIESETWKPIHEARQDAGALRDWVFYRVQYPQGTEAPYTHVTVNVYDSWADYDQQELERWVQEVYPDRSFDELAAEAQAARDYVRGEVWRELDRLR
ncbi:MAG: hypothetical protein R3314_14870 [Longimicrobiales bacterium]|nr:hypothetical protein [Longimicrobiales bacterium]